MFKTIVFFCWDTHGTANGLRGAKATITNHRACAQPEAVEETRRPNRRRGAKVCFTNTHAGAQEKFAAFGRAW